MGNVTMGRREFLGWAAGSAAAATACGWAGAGQAQDQAGPAPVRAITRGPKFHWFGYYDKLQIDPTGRYARV